MSDAQPLIWALLGARTGDNNQVIALADALGLPYRPITLKYNLLRNLGPVRLGTSLVSVKARSRRQLEPPWPDLVIGIGRRSVPVARWIRQANGGRTKLVRLGNPVVDSSVFDLVITTAQYPVQPAANVLQLPLVISPYRESPKQNHEEHAYLEALPRPHLLVAVGGWAKFWTMPKAQMADALRRLGERAGRGGGTVIVVTSQRTEQSIRDLLEAECPQTANCRLIDGKMPRFPILLADADEIFVTADSVSMLSEAILTGKPVGMIGIEMTDKGRRVLGKAPSGERSQRDLRRFWQGLDEQHMIGTIDRPVASQVDDPVEIAVSAVRKVIYGARQEAHAKAS